MEEAESGKKSIFSGRKPKDLTAFPSYGESRVMKKGKPLAPVVSLPQIPKEGLTLEEKVDYLERMMLMQSKQITAILLALTE